MWSRARAWCRAAATRNGQRDPGLETVPRLFRVSNRGFSQALDSEKCEDGARSRKDCLLNALPATSLQTRAWCPTEMAVSRGLEDRLLHLGFATTFETAVLHMPQESSSGCELRWA